MNEPVRYLTAGRVAELLGVHRETIYRAIKEGRLPSARIGREHRIFLDDLAAFLGSADRARELMRGAE